MLKTNHFPFPTLSREQATPGPKAWSTGFILSLPGAAQVNPNVTPPSCVALISFFYDGYYYATSIPIHPHLQHEVLFSSAPGALPESPHQDAFWITARCKHPRPSSQNCPSKGAPAQSAASSPGLTKHRLPAPVCFSLSHSLPDS